jgi:SAM-dependent methyltransferase
MPDTIYARPDQYDLEHEGDDADVRFHVHLIRRYRPARVLELGCGSGRVTLPLAEAAAEDGCEVVGIDLDEGMLEQARKKAEGLPAEARRCLTLGPGDLRTWRSASAFDLVIVPCSTLSHLLSLDDQLSAWRTAWENLREGGRFVVDLTMPDLVAYADSMQTPPRVLVQLDIDAEAPDSRGRLIRYRTVRYLPHLQRARIHFLYDAFTSSDEARRYISDFESHVYFPRELELLFRLTGFEVEDAWGDYRFRPMRAASRQIIMVGRKLATGTPRAR